MSGNSSINIDLQFTANTAQAKQGIQDLANALNKVYTMSSNDSGLGLTKEIKEAQQAALELSTYLKNATDLNTGKLNLSKFSSELASSGKTLSEYYDTLNSVGSVGTQAFQQMSRAIAAAEAPTITLNKKIKDLGISLKNAITWQISTSTINAITGTISSAYNYAQRLDKVLNDIRIVSYESADQMAEFAKQANAAAKELNTTTTAYAEAALIFFQQGNCELLLGCNDKIFSWV